MTNERIPRRALICGISGQDGAYLAQLLLSKGYEVWGSSRHPDRHAFDGLRALGVWDQVKLISMQVHDFQCVHQVFSEVQPQEVYNLAGQSSVGASFEQPLETMTSIATGTLHQLEAIRLIDTSIRFFNAGSGDCFGDTGVHRANEQTRFKPHSPYAVAKVAAAHHVNVYREAYGLFACTGLLFNHESPLRPERFVTMKIMAAIQRIAAGSHEKLKLGNIDIVRDWGWAPEYVDAMWRMLNHTDPDNFVIATGISHSLKDFVAAAFAEAGLDWKEHVVFDPQLQRPSDVLHSAADPSKAAQHLSWTASCAAPEVARRMYRAIQQGITLATQHF